MKLYGAASVPPSCTNTVFICLSGMCDDDCDYSTLPAFDNPVLSTLNRCPDSVQVINRHLLASMKPSVVCGGAKFT